MKKAFVLGHPIVHSRSPLIHSGWIRQYGLDASYEAIDVAPEALPVFLERLRSGEFVGGNVTIPLKELVAELCDTADIEAGIIGAVNTLSTIEAQPMRLIHGSNTDYDGFAANLDDKAPGWADGEGDIIVLGAGGAARAVLLALSNRSTRPIHLLNRTVQRAVELAAEMGPKLGRVIDAQPLSAFDGLAPRASLVVNTSAMGMHGEPMPALDLGRLPKTALVTDIVYVPLLTPLLSAARQAGLKTVDGLGMLLHQAVPGFELWFGVRPSVTPELRALVEATL